MKSSKIIMPIFLLLVFFQLMTPIKMIYDQENVLKEGKLYKFITQPIDPNDPFRGKFIRMNYEINNCKVVDTIWNKNEEIYLYIKDSIGFATLKTISKEKLNIDNDYILAKVSTYSKYNQTVFFNLPFDRFYMEESKAKPAEDLVRRNRRDTIRNTTYGLVSINNGKFVLKDVLINDISIKDLVVIYKENN